MNESNIVPPYLKRQFRMTRLRIELPKFVLMISEIILNRTKNINDEGVINLAKMLGRCTSLKYFEESIVE